MMTESVRRPRREVALAACALLTLSHAAWAQRTPRVNEVQLAPSEIHLRVGERQPFLATPYDAAGNPIDNAKFEWSSSNTGVAAVDEGGVVTGVSVGLAIITVRVGTGSEAKSAQAPVQVAAAAAAAPSAAPPNVEQQRATPGPAAVARVAILPADASVRVGELRPFLATAYDASGNATNGAAFQWSSSNPAVASVDQRGVVTGVSAGLAVISARTGADAAAKSAEAPVQVGAAAPAASPAGGAPPAAPATGAGRADSLRRACEGGDAAGCNALGAMYSHGVGVALDLDQARSLYTRSCDAGNADACNNLGVLYDYGRGVAQDQARAHVLFQRSCDNGNPYGCFNLGVAYEAGRGVSIDLAQAAVLFRRTCEAGTAIGNARGCTRLAELYQTGRGVRRDQAQARAYFQRGCNGGDLVACNRLQRAK